MNARLQKYFLVTFLLLSNFTAFAIPTVRLHAGMTIKESVIISKELYFLNAPKNLQEALVVIDGQNIIIDFNQSLLQGSNDKINPDEFYGLSLLIKKGSKNITIKNANMHGFKVAIFADSIENLVIMNCDLSYNWRQHLHSSLEKEDISDWMSYHHNENDEWLRYGAAMYLKNCKKAIVYNNIVTGGQCALMMTRCENTEVYDNHFSFNSGIGIGLYRSSHNTIYHNQLDYNVRGYRDGTYNRGQDSAGILVYEQSSNNIFAFNSATHSGDGFFLWAGQSTLDTGLGGCNDNFIYGNDFSYASNNGIEATFSQNLIMKNNLRFCDYGIWGGYSYNTDITDNTFENNRIGIAVENGQNFNIALNSFTNGQTAIKLWSREKQPPEWNYAKTKNTESSNYWIAANRLTSIKNAFDIAKTDTVVLSGNSKLFVENNYVIAENASNIDTSRDLEFLDIDYKKDLRLQTIKADQIPVLIVPQGKKEIRMTEWGPYDFRYPILWLKEVDSNQIYRFEVLGASGKWDLHKATGFTIIEKGGNGFPSTITAKAELGKQDQQIQLAYTGASFQDIFGKKKDSSLPIYFGFNHFNTQAKWNIQFFKWDAEHDPSKGFSQFQKLLENSPVFNTVSNEIAYNWWGEIGEHLPADSFATLAKTIMQLPEGVYHIGVTADDIVKLLIDEVEVINAWDSQLTELDENTHHSITIPLKKGAHTFKLVHAEKKGLATLQFYLTRD